MSAETIEWLNANSLIGFTDKRGEAWWYRAGEDNHFPGAVPRERVLELLSYPVAESVAGSVRADYVMPDGSIKTIEAQGRKGIARLDTGVTFEFFKSGYQIHQPVEWTLETLDKLLHGGLEIGSAVVLQEGAVVAVQGELPETREAAEGVLFRPFLTAATSMNGRIASSFVRGAQVVHCDNTLSAALYQDETRSKVKARHTSGSLSKLGEIRAALSLEVEMIGDAFDAEVAALTSEFVSDERWAEFVKAFTEVEKKPAGRSLTIAQNKAGVLNKLWADDPRVAPWKNSAYGVLSAVNTATHHIWGSDANRAERNQLRTVGVMDSWDVVDGSTLKLLATV